MRIHRIIILIAIGFVANPPAMAQLSDGTHQLVVHVIEPGAGNAPVQSAWVEVLENSQSGATDRNGEFRRGGYREGQRVRVQVSKVGLLNDPQEEEVVANGESQVVWLYDVNGTSDYYRDLAAAVSAIPGRAGESEAQRLERIRGRLSGLSADKLNVFEIEYVRRLPRGLAPDVESPWRPGPDPRRLEPVERPERFRQERLLQERFRQ